MAGSKKDINRSYQLAKEYFLEALMRKPTDGANYAQYAWYIGESDETNQAMGYFEKAISLYMTDAYVHRQYAMWCVNQAKKKINFRNMSLFEAGYKSEHMKAGIMHFYDNRFINGVSITTFLEKAKVEWDKALSLGLYRNDRVHNRERAYNRLGDFNLIRYKIDGAIGNFKRANTKFMVVKYYSLAELNLMMYEVDGAIGCYMRANNKLMLANCYYIKEDYDNAMNAIGSIIVDGSEQFQENWNEIRKILRVIIKHNPENHQAFYWFGKIYTRLNMNNRAIKNFKKAVQLNPMHLDAHLSLAKLYKLAGKSEMAFHEYETVLSLNPNHEEATDFIHESIRETY